MGMIDKNFKNHIKNLVEDDLIIVSFCNKLYKHIAVNWVAHLQLLNIKNYVVIATDRETEKYLIKHKETLYFSFFMNPLRALSIYKQLT